MAAKSDHRREGGHRRHPRRLCGACADELLDYRANKVERLERPTRCAIELSQVHDALVLEELVIDEFSERERSFEMGNRERGSFRP